MTGRAGAHVQDDLAEGARRAGRARTRHRVGREHGARGAVLARLRRAVVDGELAVRAVVAGRAQALIGDETLETRASVQAWPRGARAQRHLAVRARETRLTLTRVEVGHRLHAHAVVLARAGRARVDQCAACGARVPDETSTLVLAWYARRVADTAVLTRCVQTWV